jgi:hypothetical protein
LAGYGDAHFRVEKGVAELAQMLDASGKGAVQSAQKILATVAKEKGNG